MSASPTDPTDWSASDWSAYLTRELGFPVHVTYGRARRYVLRMGDLSGAPASVRKPAGVGVWVRMNQFFGSAPDTVRKAIVTWIRSGKRSKRNNELLDRWVNERVGELEVQAPRQRKVTLQGDHHDLEPLLQDLLNKEFAEDFDEQHPAPSVSWGRRGKSKTRHSIQLGIFDYRARCVRINRVLDQPAVPDWVVRYVVFHELLHAVLAKAGWERGHRHHGPDFSNREKTYLDFERVLRWEAQHLPEILRSARTGTPMKVRKPKAAKQQAKTSTRDKAQPDSPNSLGQWVQRRLFGNG